MAARRGKNGKKTRKADNNIRAIRHRKDHGDKSSEEETSRAAVFDLLHD
jgi:hypothetical protein